MLLCAEQGLAPQTVLLAQPVAVGAARMPAAVLPVPPSAGGSGDACGKGEIGGEAAEACRGDSGCVLSGGRGGSVVA